MLIWILAALSCMTANAGDLDIEAGVIASQSVPTDSNKPFLGFGVSAIAFYEFENISFGVQARSIFTTHSVVNISADGYEVTGEFSKRQATVGGVFRYYLSARNELEPKAGRYYLQAAA